MEAIGGGREFWRRLDFVNRPHSKESDKTFGAGLVQWENKKYQAWFICKWVGFNARGGMSN